MGRTIFIGDIHGCADELDELLYQLSYKPAFDKLYLTGDAFARGPEPADVLELIEETHAQSVLGNHDYAMLRYLDRNEDAPDIKISKSQQECLKQMKHKKREFRDYLRSLPVSINSVSWILVHAGIDPSKGIEGTDLDTALTIRTWPGPNVEGAPKWYESYKGDTLIIFGHDAKGGKVRHEHKGKPNAVGLDTGCVYGGELTAYILEEDAFVSVKAAEMYYDPDSARKNNHE